MSPNSKHRGDPGLGLWAPLFLPLVCLVIAARLTASNHIYTLPTLSGIPPTETSTLNSDSFYPKLSTWSSSPPPSLLGAVLFQSMATPPCQVLRPKPGGNHLSSLILHIQSANKTCWLYLNIYPEPNHFSLYTLRLSWYQTAMAS